MFEKRIEFNVGPNLYQVLTEDTVGLLDCLAHCDELKIPYVVVHNQKKYIVKKVMKFALANSRIKTLTFDNDSQIDEIMNFGLANRFMKKIVLPNTIKVIHPLTFYDVKCTVIFNGQTNGKIFNGDGGLTKMYPHDVMIGFKDRKKVFNRESIHGIDSYSFWRSDTLRMIIFPSSLKCIGSYAFNGCMNLEKVIFRKNCLIEKINEESFSFCSIKRIVIPASVKTIGVSAFSSNPLSKLIFKQGSVLEEINGEAFSRCNIKKIIFPETLQKIGSRAFFRNKCDLVVFPDNSKIEQVDTTAFSIKIENFKYPQEKMAIFEELCFNDEY